MDNMTESRWIGVSPYETLFAGVRASQSLLVSVANSYTTDFIIDGGYCADNLACRRGESQKNVSAV
jgi:hypothetical protein